MQDHIDICTKDNGFINGMDARAKMFFSMACVAVSVAAKGPSAPLFVGASCLVFLLASGVSLRRIVLRAAGPLFFAAVVTAFKGPLTLAHAFGAVLAVLFLSMTTPAHRLLSASAWFRLPAGFVELTLITYRYIFVLIEDSFKVYHAQRGRLGYINFRTGIKSMGTLCGSVFLRAFSQAEATGAAMAMRGYTGEYIPACKEQMRLPDAVFLAANLSCCILLFLWT
jgi:cobalt/nickel transport system permease protein